MVLVHFRKQAKRADYQCFRCHKRCDVLCWYISKTGNFGVKL